jgi:hypothetical protein
VILLALFLFGGVVLGASTIAVVLFALHKFW